MSLKLHLSHAILTFLILFPVAENLGQTLTWNPNPQFPPRIDLPFNWSPFQNPAGKDLKFSNNLPAIADFAETFTVGDVFVHGPTTIIGRGGTLDVRELNVGGCSTDCSNESLFTAELNLDAEAIWVQGRPMALVGGNHVAEFVNVSSIDEDAPGEITLNGGSISIDGNSVVQGGDLVFTNSSVDASVLFVAEYMSDAQIRSRLIIEDNSEVTASIVALGDVPSTDFGPGEMSIELSELNVTSLMSVINGSDFHSDSSILSIGGLMVGNAFNDEESIYSPTFEIENTSAYLGGMRLTANGNVTLNDSYLQVSDDLDIPVTIEGSLFLKHGSVMNVQNDLLIRQDSRFLDETSSVLVEESTLTVAKDIFIGESSKEGELELQDSTLIVDDITINAGGLIMYQSSVTADNIVLNGESNEIVVYKGEINAEHMSLAGGGKLELTSLGLEEAPILDIANLEITDAYLDSLFVASAVESGRSLKIINVREQLIGQFSNYSEGDLFQTVNGQEVFITYRGGDGNDIVLYTNPSDQTDFSDRLGLRRGNKFILDANGDGAFDAQEDFVTSFGLANDTPVIGDFNGDGLTELGVRRGNKFILDLNGDGAFQTGEDMVTTFGLPGDVPVVGDFNGDGFTELGVRRGNKFILDLNGDGEFHPNEDLVTTFGLASDIPIVGDWNGDGFTKLGVRRGNKFILDFDGDGSFQPGQDVVVAFGLANDTAVVGDWNGDGKTELGVRRGRTFFLDLNGDRAFNPNQDTAVAFGLADDIPVVGAWE